MREQTVTYADLKFHTSAGKKKGRPKHSKSTEMREQEVNYLDPRFHTSMLQEKQMPTITENRGSYSPSLPWRSIAGTLGIVCLALLVTVGTLGAMVLQDSHELRKNDEKLIRHEKISNNLTQLQETLENCTKHRDDFQVQIVKLSNEVKRKGKICSRCPEGWILHEEICYFFSNEEKTWQDSKQYCSNQNSRLLSINNKKELDFITSLQCFHWIGLSRKDATSQLSWEDGTTYATDWFQEETLVGESCARFYRRISFVYKCTQLARYICEKMAVQ